MQTKLLTRTNFCAAFVAAAMFLGGCKDSTLDEEFSAINVQEAKGSQTAQSIMVDFGTTGEDYMIYEDLVYVFDDVAAAIEHHDYNSCTTNTCRNQARQAARTARCTYWNQDGHPFWTIDEVASTEGTIDIANDITLAAQSFVLNKQNPTRGKYSFDLGTATTPRITNLRYSVNGGEDVSLGHTIESGDDYTYTASPLQKFGSAQSYLQDGLVSTILASDDFAANNTSSNFIKATSSITLEDLSEAGTYTVTIKGTFKGNDGQANSAFEVHKTSTITAGNCAN